MSGFKMMPLQRKISGSKRNRHDCDELNFPGVPGLNFSDLPKTPVKRQKTPRSGYEPQEDQRQSKFEPYTSMPDSARNLSLEDDPAFHEDVPPEIESPRFATPQQEAHFYSSNFEFPALSDDILNSCRSAPTPGRADFDFAFDRGFDDIDDTFLTMRGTRSAGESRPDFLYKLNMLGPERVRHSDGSGRILDSFASRAEAQSYNLRLARELKQTLPCAPPVPGRSFFQFPLPQTSGRASRRDSARSSVRMSTRSSSRLSEVSSGRSSQVSSVPSSQHSSAPGSARAQRFQPQRCIPIANNNKNSPQRNNKNNNSLQDPNSTPPQPRKRKLCRHFLKGYCKQGEKCNFLHDASIFSPDTHKVFLGGLPANATSDGLVKELGKHGFKVTNRPQVLRGFSPKVCMDSAFVVKDLCNKGHIRLWGTRVDVRPYQDKKPDSEARRSVFLGGLADNTTAADIRAALVMVGAQLKNTPVLKSGFAPQVMVGSAEQAQMLVQVKKILCAGKMIDVRPFVDLRPRKRSNH